MGRNETLLPFPGTPWNKHNDCHGVGDLMICTCGVHSVYAWGLKLNLCGFLEHGKKITHMVALQLASSPQALFLFVF